MANRIYDYCKKQAIPTTNSETLRRFVRVNALNFCIEFGEDMASALSETTISKVISMIGGETN